MKLFENKYKKRIESKIQDLLIQIAHLREAEERTSILKPEERVKFIVARQNCQLHIDLLKSLL